MLDIMVFIKLSISLLNTIDVVLVIILSLITT